METAVIMLFAKKALFFGIGFFPSKAYVMGGAKRWKKVVFSLFAFVVAFLFTALAGKDSALASYAMGVFMGLTWPAFDVVNKKAWAFLKGGFKAVRQEQSKPAEALPAANKPD